MRTAQPVWRSDMGVEDTSSHCERTGLDLTVDA